MVQCISRELPWLRLQGTERLSAARCCGVRVLHCELSCDPNPDQQPAARSHKEPTPKGNLGPETALACFGTVTTCHGGELFDLEEFPGSPPQPQHPI